MIQSMQERQRLEGKHGVRLRMPSDLVVIFRLSWFRLLYGCRDPRARIDASGLRE